MSGAVAVMLAALGLALIVVGIRGTYGDVTALLLHPSKGHEATQGINEANPAGKEPAPVVKGG